MNAITRRGLVPLAGALALPVGGAVTTPAAAAAPAPSPDAALLALCASWQPAADVCQCAYDLLAGAVATGIMSIDAINALDEKMCAGPEDECRRIERAIAD
ncbi:hypothetical protein M0638_28050, partial [Roseomonas sp. NAR14]